MVWFFFMAEEQSVVCVHHVFICSPVHERSDRFQVLAVINGAMWTLGTCIFFNWSFPRIEHITVLRTSSLLPAKGDSI